MLCRRCGMESSTTDVCEWCKRPMLPPGAQVTGQAQAPTKEQQKAAEPPGRSLGEVTGADAAQEEEFAGEHPAPQAELRPLGGHAGSAEKAEPPAPPAQEANFLEPPPTHPTPASPRQAEPAASPQEPETTAPAQPKSGRLGAPSHGLSNEATATSIDISAYMGDDDSIFRPIVREEPKGQDTQDLLKQRHRQRLEASQGPQMSENQRLLRCLIAGLAVAIPIALLQYLITKNTVTVLFTSFTLSRTTSLMAALKYGVASGLMFGFGLGALLVRLKKGSGMGFFVGVVLGLTAMGNGLWGALAGAIIGIYAGKVAMAGVRRVVNV